MKMRRVLTAMLAVAMLLSVLPVVSYGVTTNDMNTAGTTTGPYDNSELYLGKTATLENDGTYTIRLEAFATGNPVTTQIRSGLPLDIVLVLDQSGSMFANGYLETLRDSVDEFIDVIAANGRSIGVTHRVAIVGFASDEDDGSSGNAENTDHQLAGGSDNRYTNTGVFLEDGSFKNYGDAATSYVELVGDPEVGGTYYIRDDNRNYQKLTASTGYVAVANPDTNRDDLYARVNNSYYLAGYEQNAYYEVTNLDGSKTYYVDVNGTKMPITATGATTYNYTRVNSTSDRDGRTYYISTSSANGTDFIKITCTSSGYPWSPTYTWEDEDGNVYTRGNNGRFTRSDTTYYAYNRTETTTYTWKLADGTVVDPTAQTVYEKLSGWVYYNNGAFHLYTGTLYEETGYTWTYDGDTYDPATNQFFVQATTGGLTADDYRDALMPVTTGQAGAGSITPALDIAVSKIASSGATRTSLGMELAKNVLDNRTSLDDDDDRQTVVVVFTDGNPGFSGFEHSEANAAMAISAQMKASKDNGGHNATVYTIGLYTEASNESEISVFMHGLSSNFPTATKMTDVATVSYKSQTINFANEGLTTTPKIFENYTRRVNAGDSSTETYNYQPIRGSIDADGDILLEYLSGSTWTEWTGYSSTREVYVRSSTAYDTTGKHYMYAVNQDALYDIFPEIVTDSTTTTLDQKYLTTDTLLRDILETGFVFTNGTTVTMSSLSGTLGTDKKITWAGSETVIDSVTVTDPNAEVTASASGNVSVHNQGNYLFVEATGFDFNANYFSQGGHENGAKMIVTITRVEATDAVNWNQTNLTNNPYSGVWSPVLEDGTRAQIGVFPQPNTIFTDTVVVMDYAKTTDDLAAQIRQSGVKHLDNDGMNYFSAAANLINDTYGNANVTDGKLTYTPTTMKWDGYDAFYVFGNTTDAEILRHSANKVNSNVWSKVTVIPANNVYFEDTFIEKIDGEAPDWSKVTVGIEYTGDWTTVQPGSNTEKPETGESTADSAQGGVHGWEDSLSDDIGHSDGTAAVGGNLATATFTFTGTGVDIYSRTNMQTGVIMASIYAGEEATGLALRTLVVDNFAHSGDYYMIPTLSMHQKVLRDETGKTILDENKATQYVDLEHGTYTVKLTVVARTDDADLDGTKTTRSTYYLDGIRVYNPIAVDETVKDAYGDEELNAAFVEVRDILLDANTFAADAEESQGAVFIDQILNKDEEGNVTSDTVPGSTTEIGVYEDIGPANEVYLSAGQMIVFAPEQGATYYVGLKSPTGEAVQVMLSSENMEKITIDHTTDLFYEVTPSANGFVTIHNTSGGLLAVTKIKVAAPDPAVTAFAMFRSVRREEVLDAANAAYAAAEIETPVVEPDHSDIVIQNPNVEIENPEVEENKPEPEPEPSLVEILSKLVERIYKDLWAWFR